MNNKVIYTTIFEDYDNLIEPAVILNDWDYICFTESNLKSKIWEVKKINRLYNDPKKENAFYKLLPHRFLSEYEYSIYIDGNILIRGNINELINNYLINNNIAMLNHEYTKNDSSKILYIINDAAARYKGIIPGNCWHEPYMSEQELIDEFNDGVRLYGYHDNNKLIGVIGIQEIKDVVMIRHAYTLTAYQGKGTGSALLEYLLNNHQNSRLLVGTWRNATWAIRFYEKFGFILHAKEQSTLLLKKYWKIPSKQIKNSVVLERF